MSTAMLVPIHESEAVASASEKLGAARQKYNAACERVRVAQMTMGGDEADPIARLDAEASLPKLKADLLKAEREATVAEGLVREAYAAERQARRKTLEPDVRKAVAGLKDALVAASAANERLRLAQFALHEATGEGFDPLSWFELTLGDGTLLTQWLARVSGARRQESTLVVPPTVNPRTVSVGDAIWVRTIHCHDGRCTSEQPGRVCRVHDNEHVDAMVYVHGQEDAPHERAGLAYNADPAVAGAARSWRWN